MATDPPCQSLPAHAGTLVVHSVGENKANLWPGRGLLLEYNTKGVQPLLPARGVGGDATILRGQGGLG